MKQLLKQALAVIEMQQNGLLWYREEHPESVNGSDAEVYECAVVLKAELEKPEGCLSNCDTCTYAWSSPANPGHCYMFFEEPQGVCAKHSEPHQTHNCSRHPDAPHVLVPESMVIDSESVRFLDSLSQPDDDGNYSEIRLLFGNGHAGYGLYACLDEYPEEGAEIIYRVTAISQGATHQTRNCSRHPAAPHGPGGAGCKCHNWTPGEAS